MTRHENLNQRTILEVGAACEAVNNPAMCSYTNNEYINFFSIANFCKVLKVMYVGKTKHDDQISSNIGVNLHLLSI